MILCAFLFSTALMAQAGDVTTRPANDSAAPILAEHMRLVDRADERVSVLENGLRVILKAHRTAPVVSVRMYCRTGSIYEQEYLGSGMSHLFEHLLHGGETTTRSEAESRALLDHIGGNTNAYTTYDLTCYYIDTSVEHLATAVELLGDWITNPTFPEAAFQREWGVVQRELERDLDDPSTQLHEMTMETLFQVHPARYPIIGHQPIVQKLRKDDIVAYYERMYVPDNIVVCIVGDIELDPTLDTVRRAFASFTRRKLPTIVLPEEPEVVTPRSAVKKMQVETAIMQLAWPSIPLIHPDLYALDLLSYILTQGDSSRLVRAIRDAGLVYSIDSYSWTPDWARGIFAIQSRLAPDKVEAARAAILEQIAAIQKDLVSDDELAQAKRQKASEHVFAMQKADEVAEMLARDFIATGDIHFSQAYVDRIQEVTAEQVREVARRYLVPQRLATITILPEGETAASERLATTGEPEPTRLIRLDNGLRCLIRRDPTTPLVSIGAFSLGGVLMETADTNGYSRLAALTAPRGTTSRTAGEIARFFDARGATFNGASGSNTIYFQAQVLKDDFVESLEVLADVVCHPTFPAAELDIVRQRVLDEIAQIDESWRPETITFLLARLFPQSPYGRPPVGSADVVKAATSEKVAAFYRSLVTGPNTVVGIFGDVDVTAAETLVRRLFADLPDTARPLPKVAPQRADEPALFIRPKPPTRTAAGIGIGFVGMKMTDTDDVAATAVLDTIISGYRYPTGWIYNELRGRERSLVYEVHAINVPGPIPGYFAIYAACQPAQVREVYAIISEQLEWAKRGAFAPEEMQQARSIIATTELMQTQTNQERAMQACLDELYGLGHDYREKFRAAVGRVTAEDVARMARKYFTAPTVVVVTPDPEQAKLEIPNVRVETLDTAGK